MARSVEDIEQFSIDNEYQYDDIIQSSSRTYLTRYNSRSDDTDTQSQVQVDPPRQQKGIARAVACVAITFLLVCLLMVGASLFMSKDIDSKVIRIVNTLSKIGDVCPCVLYSEMSPGCVI
ncbi:hypothetical protein ACF0H5_012539 [Mactra antiquata]